MFIFPGAFWSWPSSAGWQSGRLDPEATTQLHFFLLRHGLKVSRSSKRFSCLCFAFSAIKLMHCRAKNLCHTQQGAGISTRLSGWVSFFVIRLRIIFITILTFKIAARAFDLCVQHFSFAGNPCLLVEVIRDGDESVLCNADHSKLGEL